jgi:hypothetical protein
LVVWDQGPIRPSKIMVATSTDRGATFAAPLRLSDSTHNASCPTLVSDGAGTVVAVWDQSEIPIQPVSTDSIVVSRSIDGGLTWDTPRTLASVTEPVAFTCIHPVATPEGNLDLVYGTQDLSKVASQQTSFVILSPDLGASHSVPLPLDPVNSIDGQCPWAVARSGSRLGLVWAVETDPVNGNDDVFFVSALATP